MTGRCWTPRVYPRRDSPEWERGPAGFLRKKTEFRKMRPLPKCPPGQHWARGPKGMPGSCREGARKVRTPHARLMGDIRLRGQPCPEGKQRSPKSGRCVKIRLPKGSTVQFVEPEQYI